ncbi:GTP pyrophosphokinase [Anaeroarcus burkinensis]|uniref:GTP pyrophosphokinase n=1 Tax=Anaeroarcus burkinensis TaxID=82376 RepID=UPI000416E9A9|nr:RelA/SpoT domain-containing protein [Anaeroarcus burkinensis]
MQYQLGMKENTEMKNSLEKEGNFLLDSFLEQYQHRRTLYQQGAEECAAKCEQVLAQNGIRALVTSRAKRVERLREKLYKREEEYRNSNNGITKYKTFEDIEADIVDLAGVRISLYFPGDREEVHKIIHDCFSVRQIKTFPTGKAARSAEGYLKRFSGYSANHYRIFLGEETKDYQGILAEIQVASVLMHAWAEVEHDLSYKTYNGLLSEEEVAILDELNGLVLAGEISLERLQRAIRCRVDVPPRPFANHYELAVFLLDYVRKQSLVEKETLSVGNAELLFRLLKKIGMDHPQDLCEYLQNLDTDLEWHTLTEQFLDSLFMNKPEYYPIYQRLKRESLSESASGSSRREQLDDAIQKTLGFFLFRWMLFESTMRSLLERREIVWTSISNGIRELYEGEWITEDMLSELTRLRSLRHALLHEHTPPKGSDLLEGAYFLELVIQQLLPYLPADLWQNTLKKLAPLTKEESA